MQSYYTVAHVALITGLSSRTIRSHMKTGFLTGEMVNGLWHFTKEQVCEYIAHPAVAPSIKARRNALVYDFLIDEHKREAAMCAVIDEPATLDQANAASEFFCRAITDDMSESVCFGFSFSRGIMSIILKGKEEAVQNLLSSYRKFSREQ